MATFVKPVGIVIATRWEAAVALRRLGFRRVKKDFYHADVDGRPVLLSISGVGMDAARVAANRLCDQGAGELVSAGFCGALIPELRIGDLVTDRIATSPVPVRTLQERQALTQKANAVAVDMETRAIIEAGTRRGVPIHILRVVSDRVEDDLTSLFGADAHFSPWRIGFRLLNPRVWPLANTLRHHSALAKARLAEALAVYLGAKS